MSQTLQFTMPGAVARGLPLRSLGAKTSRRRFGRGYQIAVTATPRVARTLLDRCEANVAGHLFDVAPNQRYACASAASRIRLALEERL